MNKKTSAKDDATKKPANTTADDKVSGSHKKVDAKPAGDAAYNAQQQKNDRSGLNRHAGESEMNDENRSGGSRQ